MMKNERVFLAATGRVLSRAEKVGGQWEVTRPLEGVKVNCIIRHIKNPKTVYVGTQTGGILISQDAGKSWQASGLTGIPVKSLAVDPSDPATLYAGCKPVSLYVSQNGGETWTELEAIRSTRKWWWFSPADPPGMTPYISGLAVSPEDPNIILAGIEAGAVMRSGDRGRTWSKHLRGSDRDCHSLTFHHTDGDWAYEAGGMSGVAFSQNGGVDWRKPLEGLGKKYGWAVAADPERSEIWYLSAAEQGKLLKGEFAPPGHNDGQANAHLYRKIGDEPWEQLAGGLTEPLDYMAYGLAVVPEQPGYVYAGLGNGQVWFSEDYGDHWALMPFNLCGVHNAFAVI
jgi:photosystem II stability/assembly factor-like uncharacterized protein